MLFRVTFLVAITCGLLVGTARAVETFDFNAVSDGMVQSTRRLPPATTLLPGQGLFKSLAVNLL